MDLLHIPFVAMTSYPGAALVPGVVILVALLLRGRRLQGTGRVFVAGVAVLWLIYGIYETVMYFWMQTVIAPIRVDLLFLAPLLWAFTAAALAVLLAGARRSTP